MNRLQTIIRFTSCFFGDIVELSSLVDVVSISVETLI